MTSATVTFPVTAANNKIHYRAVITNGEGTVTTVPVTLTVNKKSATADDRTSLAIAAKAALAAISRCRQATEQMAKNLTQDLRRLKASSDVKAKLSAYITNERASRAQFTRDEKAYLHTLQSLAAKADAASQQLKKKPGDATLLAKAQAAAAALTAAASTSNMPADASNCSLGQISKLADLSAVAPDDAKLNQDLYAAGVSAYDIGQQLQAPVVVAQSVATRLTNDAQA